MTSHRGRGSLRTIAVVTVVGLVTSLLLAGLVSFYADPHPDGLEAVAQRHGFDDRARESGAAGSPLADYRAGGVSDERWSVGLSGAAGVVVTAALGFGLFLILAAGRDRVIAGAADPDRGRDLPVDGPRPTSDGDRAGSG